MIPKRLDRALIGTCVLGILVATYALYVEMAAEVDPGYTAMCDIGEYASCSRVLTSSYSKTFGLFSEDSPVSIPNCIFGILFYCLMIFLSTFHRRFIINFQFWNAIISMGSSVYLAILLVFVLRDFCIVCVSTYIINGFLVSITWKRVKALPQKND